jgi:hypothetical protein
LDFLQNEGIIKTKKKHNPITGQKFVDKIENGHNIILIPLVPQGNIYRTKSQWNKKFPKNINKNKINLVIGINLHLMRQMQETHKGGAQESKESKSEFLYN